MRHKMLFSVVILSILAMAFPAIVVSQMSHSVEYEIDGTIGVNGTRINTRVSGVGNITPQQIINDYQIAPHSSSFYEIINWFDTEAVFNNLNEASVIQLCEPPIYYHESDKAAFEGKPINPHRFDLQVADNRVLNDEIIKDWYSLF
ncbi:MAG: hypothetical protein SCJ94_12200 [Bacillota bacterium]|nr:hypothetical protein [Bacillota bacterium]